MRRAASDGQSLTARPSEGTQESPGGMAVGEAPLRRQSACQGPGPAGNPGRGAQAAAQEEPRRDGASPKVREGQAVREDTLSFDSG